MIEKWMDGWTVWLMGGSGCIGQVGGWMDRWIDRWMVGIMDSRMDELHGGEMDGAVGYLIYGQIWIDWFSE